MMMMIMVMVMEMAAADDEDDGWRSKIVIDDFGRKVR